MSISKSTYELLTPIINAIDKSVVIKTVEELVVAGAGITGEYKLFSCDTAWATQGFSVTIQGNVYKIKSIETNVFLIVTGSVLPTIGSFDLYAPKFYHGSIKVAEAGLAAKVNGSLLSSDKLPMIWLQEPIEERVSDDLEEAIYMFSPCDLYFMVDADIAKWTQDNHYTQAIKPMRQLISRFKTAMKYAGLVNMDEMQDSRSTDLPRFGRYTAENGAEKAVFAQYPMSGTKLTIEIAFIRNSKNCC